MRLSAVWADSSTTSASVFSHSSRRGSNPSVGSESSYRNGLVHGQEPQEAETSEGGLAVLPSGLVVPSGRYGDLVDLVVGVSGAFVDALDRFLTGPL